MDEIGPARLWRSFGLTFLGAVAACLLAGLATTIFVDPYWIFRDTPPWLARTGGLNRHLDLEMRRSKPLQLFTRDAPTVLVGSSVVYRGLDPADVEGGAYNLGLSALMAEELPVVAALVAARRPRRVLLELDAFMFSTFPAPPPVDPRLAKAAGRATAWLSAALSLRALVGSWPAEIARAPEPGFWTRNGFKATPPYGRAMTLRIAAQQDFAGMRYRPETLAYLEAALRLLRGLDIRLTLSPMSRPQLALAEAAGRSDELARWRTDVAELAHRTGTRFVDLVDAAPPDAFDPATGSSPLWLDNLHPTPELGRWILARNCLARNQAC